MGNVEWLIIFLLIVAIAVIFTLVFRSRRRKSQTSRDIVTEPPPAGDRAPDKPGPLESQTPKPQVSDIRYKGRPGEIDMPREKRVLFAYLFWGFLGFIGGHRHYLGKHITGLIFVLVPVGAVFAALFFSNAVEEVSAIGRIAEVFVVALIALWIFWIVDAFRLPGMTRAVNRKLWQTWYDSQSDRETVVSGKVSNLVKRVGDDLGGRVVLTKQVLNFRVEGAATEGHEQSLIQVELIGNTITGDLHEGDMVTVRGKLSQENILRTLEVQNRTTNSLVKVGF